MPLKLFFSRVTLGSRKVSSIHNQTTSKSLKAKPSNEEMTLRDIDDETPAKEQYVFNDTLKENPNPKDQVSGNTDCCRSLQVLSLASN